MQAMRYIGCRKGMLNLLTILQQLFVLYAFILMGWFFGRRKPNLVSASTVLSYVAANLFLPCKVLRSFANNFTVDYIRNNYMVLLFSLGFLLLFVLIALVISKPLTKNLYEQRVYRYSFAICNYAYMGYVLAEEFWGPTGLTGMTLFCIPFSIYTYSFGYMLLTGATNSYKKLINPMTICILVGCVLGLSGFQMPTMVDKFLSTASSCAGPVAMLLTGLSLSAFNVKELLSHKTTYIVCGVRLIGIPLLAFILCKLLPLDSVFPYVMLMTCMPCGLNPIIFPKLIGEDVTIGARLAFISHLFSVATLPVWLSLIV